MASVDDAATLLAFAKENGADFPVLSDPEKATAAAYGVLTQAGYAARWTFYIDRDGKVAHIDKKVNPLTAGEDIAARLHLLGVPESTASER